MISNFDDNLPPSPTPMPDASAPEHTATPPDFAEFTEFFGGPPPAAPDEAEAPPVMMLEDIYFKAFIGHTVSATEMPRAVYSLTKLCTMVRLSDGVTEEQAQAATINLVHKVTDEFGDRAPVFIDDAISQPAADEPGKIITDLNGWKPE